MKTHRLTASIEIKKANAFGNENTSCSTLGCPMPTGLRNYATHDRQ